MPPRNHAQANDSGSASRLRRRGNLTHRFVERALGGRYTGRPTDLSGVRHVSRRWLITVASRARSMRSTWPRPCCRSLQGWPVAFVVSILPDHALRSERCPVSFRRNLAVFPFGCEPRVFGGVWQCRHRRSVGFDPVGQELAVSTVGLVVVHQLVHIHLDAQARFFDPAPF